MAIAIAISGCGSSAPAAATRASSHGTAVQIHTSAQAPPTRAQALAFAGQVNLTASDVPESKVSASRQRAHKSVADQRRLAHEYEACEHPVVRTYLPLQSPSLQRGRGLETEEFLSVVSFTRDPRSLVADLHRLGRASVLECVSRVATNQVEGYKLRFAQFGRVHLARLSVPLPGPTFGFRMTMTLHGTFTEVTVPIYVDYLGFADGHALVGVIAVSPTQPVPATTERELVELLHTRAAAHRI